MATETPTQTVDETLEKTDLGHVINQNKNPILILGAIIVVAVIAISFYQHQSNQEEVESLNDAFKFQTSVIDPFLDGKANAEETIKKINNINVALAGEANLAPAIFQVVDKLMKDGKTEEATGILTAWNNQFPSGSYLKFFSGLRLAPMLENQGKKEEAISIYEALLQNNHELLEAKLYLELGRLYKEQGQKEKAKSFFDHIVKNHESTEEAKLAKLYIQSLGK